jgi:ADP-dependent NAD(P)H-hydrate dehydratase / NAD(P)H-hydrate epimerase
MAAGDELLDTVEMGLADRLAVATGVPSLTLMENAGRAVADAAGRMVAPGARIVVLCGPGNNGGDGFVAARLLAERGFAVKVGCTVAREALKGDAAEMARRWAGRIEPPPAFRRKVETGNVTHSVMTVMQGPAVLDDVDLVIDALLGAGLDRPLSGAIADHVLWVNSLSTRPERPVPVLAVDVPSGLNGTTGDVPGGQGSRSVVRASRTVTFFRLKAGHVLMPGRGLCGEVTVSDIGIPESVLAEIKPQTWRNGPDIWADCDWRSIDPSPAVHKYDRGHALVVSGPAHQTGAARMGARGALRIGAGLVTVASPGLALAVNAAHLTAIMVKPCDSPKGLAEILEDARKNAVLIGPGCGVGVETCELVAAALATKAACVLDADALTSFAARRAPIGRARRRCSR